MSNVEFQWDVPDYFNFAVDVVDYWAQDPERLALIAVNETGVQQTFTYRDISKAANRLASLLRANGLVKGDRVMVMLPRIAEWQIAMVAVMRLGVVPIPCVTMLTEKDVAYRVAHSGAVGAITLSAETHKYAALKEVKGKVSVGGVQEE